MGNFSTLQDLPEMYRHCKANEDKDMTVLDFVTDHLINIDGIFDKHENGDEQKPHSPIQNQHTSQVVSFQFPTAFIFKTANIFCKTETFLSLSANFFPSDYISNIFRPPMTA